MPEFGLVRPSAGCSLERCATPFKPLKAAAKYRKPNTRTWRHNQSTKRTPRITDASTIIRSKKLFLPTLYITKTYKKPAIKERIARGKITINVSAPQTPFFLVSLRCDQILGVEIPGKEGFEVFNGACGGQCA
ncbi:MAG: hypothetical protein WCY08_10650, partial [Rhodocyclaceae bacterium]